MGASSTVLFRQAGQLAILLCLLLTPFRATCASAKSDAKAALDASFADYRNGDLTRSVQRLESTLNTSGSRLAGRERVDVMAALVDICVRIYDFECIASWAGKVANGILELPFENELVGRGRQFQAGYYWSLLSLVIDTKESAEAALDNVLEQPDEVTFDQAIFLRRQVLAAQFHLKLDDRVAARRAVDRALATLLSLTNANVYRWQFATSFVECLQILIAVGDVDRARGLYLHGGDYIVQSLSETSIDYVRYRLFESELQQQSGDVVGAATTSAMASKTLESLHLPTRIHAIWEYQVDVQQAFAAILNGDRDVAEHSLGRLEKFVNLPKLRKVGKWEWPGQVIVVATRALWQSFNRVSVDQQDLALLRTASGFSAEVYQAELFDLYRRIALLLAEGAFREGALPSDFRPIAHDYVAWTRKRARHSFDVFPRPDTVDRVICILLLRLLANERQEQPGDGDLAIVLADIATRTERAFDSEAQALLGLAQSTDDKNLLQQGLRLSSRRARYEQEEVRRITTAGKSDDADIGYMKVDFSRRAIHAEFAVELDRIRAHFQVTAPGINSNPLLPTEKEIRGALRDGEAFVWIVPVGGVFLGSVCVTKSEGLVRFTQVDLAQAQSDVKLLSLSLTATHSADERLDRQFPAEAAVRLYKTIFEPVESCLTDIRTVMWSVDLSVMSVPIATLLRSMPAKVDGGFDLRGAEWFVRRFATAYIRTPAALVALRSRGRGSDQVPFRFLGIGDPVLASAGTIEPQTGLQEGRESSLDAALSSLTPLPETRDELVAVSRILGDPAVVLVGDQATESQFRRMPVSQYRYLSFATHALVREELPGIRESAIVLTRGSTTDAFDDGLLNASEIADLQLSAEFVALSACNTANVQLSEFAADIPSLATAFAVAGTPATLATLWSVESDSSKSIVQNVFTKLVGAENIGPAEALARAQIEFIDTQPSISRAHPRFWGAFVVFGDTSPDRASERTDELRVDNIKTLTTKGGEILGVSADEEDELLVTGFGEWNGQKFAETTLSLGADLGVRWKASSYEVGGGSVALEVAGGSITMGYLWGGPKNPIA